MIQPLVAVRFPVSVLWPLGPPSARAQLNVQPETRGVPFLPPPPHTHTHLVFIHTPPHPPFQSVRFSGFQYTLKVVQPSAPLTPDFFHHRRGTLPQISGALHPQSSLLSDTLPHRFQTVSPAQ